ncbi:sensor histidine kinase [Haloferula sp. A504]|uniref:sensor histidine kinase n=1 Tax=Haloferula sp. A504 TaxID=3373601 RepID=UPI0031C95B6B|nr:HAMP domain-containing histidine kinase [Verrucomicrobiaceae bacterium E54]
MIRKVRFPLLAKMIGWLLLHLAVLAGAFLLFLNWQLRLGLDSLLSRASGERLTTLGSVLASEMRNASRTGWAEIVRTHTEPYGVEPLLLLEDRADVLGGRVGIPPDVDERLKDFTHRGQRPPGPARREEVRPGGWRDGPGQGPPRPFGPPRDRPGSPGAAASERERGRVAQDPPEPRPVFLLRSSDGGYWAGIDLPLFNPGEDRPLHGMLLLRSGNPSAGGLFFELRPWLLGGLAVLALSLLLWAPFILGITRYLTKLSRATERIAEGRFEVKVGGSRSDELGSLGASIERMAGRLDHLLRGQKRFLGDVAHELCSPLARIRTGLGVLEHRLDDDDRKRLASIDEDVGELSELVSEVLAFTRAETAPESLKSEPVDLQDLLVEVAARECPGHAVQIEMKEGMQALADRRLLGRALANVLRNARRHGGEACRIRIRVAKAGERVRLAIEDSGPGVPKEELGKLFEPFYRPDGARTREAGGAGLGLAIVRSAIEACSGDVRAGRSDLGGLKVWIELDAP